MVQLTDANKKISKLESQPVQIVTEAGLKPNENLKRLFSGIIASECWISTWPEAYPPDGTFQNTARFSIRDSQPSPANYINTTALYNPDATGIPQTNLSPTQRFTLNLTQKYFTDRQKEMIAMNDYNISNPVMAVTVIPTFQDNGKTKFKTPAGETLEAPYSGTKFIVAGRGKMGNHTVDNSKGKFKYLPDLFQLFLSDQESLNTVMGVLNERGDLGTDDFFAALSFGSTKAYFEDSKSGNIEKIKEFIASPGNPFSKKVNFVVNSGLGNRK